MPADAALATYYARRAGEYERIYEKPERQADLRELRAWLAETFDGAEVLEVACGTGYWTEVIARTAQSVTATDINEETLAIARAKNCGPATVRFAKLNAFDSGQLDGRFNAGLAAFWWSHLKRNEWRVFLERFHCALQPGALVVFLDNRFVTGSSTPIARTDDDGNTYQLRRLSNGETHEVLKNFPTEDELRGVLRGIADDVRWSALPYYWSLSYRIAAR